MAASRSQLPTLVLLVAAALAAVSLVVRADPDITTDFVVPPNVDPGSIDGSFFTFQGLRNGANITGNGFGAAKVTQEQFVALTGLGVSTALLRYEPQGLNSPHTHPRATEVLYLITGTLTVGLIDSTNKFYGQQLFPGDVFVFPKGLVHYQWNSGNQSASAYVAFSSSNPGTVSLPKTLFGTDIEEEVLQKAFKVSANVIHQLQAPFVTPVPAPAPTFPVAPQASHHWK